jgi:hypothetical protein
MDKATCVPLLDDPVLTLQGNAVLVLSPEIPGTQYCVVCTSLKKNSVELFPGTLMTLSLEDHDFVEDYISFYLLS